MDTFDMIAIERRAVADLVDRLNDTQLATQSLCDAWNIKELAAHLTQLWNVSIPKVMLTMAKNRGDFDKTFQALCVGLADRPIDEIVADLRSHATDRTAPPASVPWLR